MQIIEIPANVKDLPKDKAGLIIPFYKGENAAERRLQCVENKLCAICGKKLDPGEYYFITHYRGKIDKISMHGAMHKDCAVYMLQAFPKRCRWELAAIPLTRKAVMEEIKHVHKFDLIYLIHASHLHFIPNQHPGGDLVKFNIIETTLYSYENDTITKK